MHRFAVTLVAASMLVVYADTQRIRRERPGTIPFSNSGAPRRVAWFHSFGYEEAIDAFRGAQKIGPSFALA